MHNSIRDVQSNKERGFMNKLKLKKIFASGFCFDKLFLFFLLGSVFGGFFEEIQWFIAHKTWTCRHDLLYGPFSTLYGFGMVIFLILLLPKNYERGIFKTFFLAFFIGGVFEYFAGVLSEQVLNIKFWDYSSMFLNIDGKTSIPIMLIWGILGVLLLKVIYPFVSRYIEKIPYKIGKILNTCLMLFLFFDMLLSYSVFVRMLMRNKEIAPKTCIGKFYDKKYNDEFMYKKYPILKGE